MSGSSFIVEEWRDLWTVKGDFIIVALAYVCSPSNFLRLPELMRKHGGGTFGVAYVASLIFCCLPLITMELAVGQLSAKAAPQAMHVICPLFKGVGVAFVVYSIIFMSTFSVQLSYLLNYLFDMFRNVHDDPRWMSCPPQLSNDVESDTTESSQSSFQRCTGFDGKDRQTCYDLRNYTWSQKDSGHSSLEEYHCVTIKDNFDIQVPGYFEWTLIVGLACAWFLVFLAIFLGVRWFGKVAYFTFTVPLLLLLVLLVKSLNAAGSEAFIRSLFVTKDWNRLLGLELWQDAFSQSLYASGLCFGTYIALGSYNKRNNNLVGDAFLIVFLHLVFSLLQLVTAGGLLGHAFATTNFTNNMTDAFPNDRTNLLLMLSSAAFNDLPQLWSAFMIFMLIFWILNILYVMSFGVLAAVEDILGERPYRCIPRLGIAFGICWLAFCVGLGYCLQSGSHAVRLVLAFLDLLTPWVLLVFEIMAVAWFYCAHLLARDVSHMLGRSKFWLCSYPVLETLYIVAAAPVYILVQKLSNYSFKKLYGNDESAAKAQWPEAIGWIVALIPVLPIALFMIYVVTKSCIRGPGFTYWDKFKHALISPLRYEVAKPMPAPRYSPNAPGYVLLPQSPPAPLAEQEQFGDAYHSERVRISKI